LKKSVLFLLLSIFTSLHAELYESRWLDGEQLPITTQNIKVLDLKEVIFPRSDLFYGLSDLAYREGKLYALSDKGVLFLLDIKIEDTKISSLELKHTYLLKNKKYKELKKSKSDAEGLCFYGDNLLISFERKHRIDLYTPKGVKLQKMKLHPYLRDKNHFIGKNKGLESVVYCTKYGILTTPELDVEDSNLHTLYSKNTLYKFYAKGSVTAMEFMDKDKLLVLTREFHYFSRERVTRMYRLDLSKCKQGRCQSEELASFQSQKGFHIDNFEGLTKVSKNRYLMISDDNESFLQKTLLVLFEVLD